TSPCRAAVDPSGMVFVAGRLCGNGLGSPKTSYSVPGVVRIDPSGPALVSAPFDDLTSAPPTPLAFPDVSPLAFDAAGNLYVFADNVLYGIDGVTSTAFDLSSKAEAGSSGPSGMAFGPRGDLYVADTGNRSIRRVVGIGADHPSEIHLVGGSHQQAAIASTLPNALTFTVMDSVGPRAAQTVIVKDDAGATVYGEQLVTRGDGKGSTTVRAGIVPRTENFRAYVLDLHGQPAGDPATFTATVAAPDP